MDSKEYLIRLRGKIFKILPIYEESGDWQYFRDLAVVELKGLQSKEERIDSVRRKLIGLGPETSEKAFRSIILRCSNIMTEVISDEQSL